MCEQHNVTVELRQEDIHAGNWPDPPYAMVVVGMTLYNPKWLVRELLTRLWCYIPPGGILHVEYCTDKDENIIYPFTTMHFYEDPKDPGSFLLMPNLARRGLYLPPGVVGASFWSEDQICVLLRELGTHKLIYKEVREFVQKFPVEEAWPDGNGTWRTDMLRSFGLVTIQKG